MKAAAEVCAEFGVGSEAKVISAHRTPRDLEQYVSSAIDRGLRRGRTVIADEQWSESHASTVRN